MQSSEKALAIMNSRDALPEVDRAFLRYVALESDISDAQKWSKYMEREFPEKRQYPEVPSDAGPFRPVRGPEVHEHRHDQQIEEYLEYEPVQQGGGRTYVNILLGLVTLTMAILQ